MSGCRKLQVADYATLTFESPDFEKFPLLRLAFDAIRRGGNFPCALNAANEVAVAAFLSDRIGFMHIPEIVATALSRNSFIEQPSYEDLIQTNSEMQAIAGGLIN